MKKLILPLFLGGLFLVSTVEINAQRRYYGNRHYHYHSRPRVMLGISGVFGGVFGGSFGSGYYGYGWGPGFGINIVIPPGERRMNDLPPGAEKRVYGGIVYYYRNNTYYRERENGGYQIVDPPLGAEIDRIPMNARLRKVEGKYYYEYEGTFFEMDKRNDGRPKYTIVGKDGELRIEEAYQNKFDQHADTPERYNKNDYINSNPVDENTPIVKNGNEEANPLLPQVGDRFEQLPKNCKEVNVNGEVQFLSPNGIYYKKQVQDGETYYEVVKSK